MEKVIQMKPLSSNSIPGAFVRWDNTARYKDKATIIKGETPENLKIIFANKLSMQRKNINLICYLCMLGMNGLKVDSWNLTK